MFKFEYSLSTSQMDTIITCASISMNKTDKGNSYNMDGNVGSIVNNVNQY